MSVTSQHLYALYCGCYVACVDNRDRSGLAEDLRQRAAQAGWTPWQLVRRIHETARTPTLLMAWRLAAGITQAQLADSLRRLAADAGSPCGPSTPSCQQISRWENGHERPSAFYLGLLTAWYRTDPNRLGLTGNPDFMANNELLWVPIALNEDDNVNLRGFLGLVNPVLFQLDQVRRRMDTDLRHVLPAAEIDQWEEIADRHTAAYGTVPPCALLTRLAPDLSELSDLVGQYPQQRDLTRLAARLCGLIGALCTDLGDDRGARDWLRTAARFTVKSGDIATRYWVAMAVAMAATYQPDPVHVLTVAAKAAVELGTCICAAAAQLTGLAARAYAAINDHKAARGQLAAAEQMASRLTAVQSDEVFFGFPSREMAMYMSQVLTAIGDPAAGDALTDALSHYPATDQMDRPLLLLARARYLARQGEPAVASQVATDALTSLAPAWRVPLLISEARAVGKAISEIAPAAGRQYAQLLREVESS